MGSALRVELNAWSCQSLPCRPSWQAGAVPTPLPSPRADVILRCALLAPPPYRQNPFRERRKPVFGEEWVMLGLGVGIIDTKKKMDHKRLRLSAAK